VFYILLFIVSYFASAPYGNVKQIKVKEMQEQAQRKPVWGSRSLESAKKEHIYIYTDQILKLLQSNQSDSCGHSDSAKPLT